jgi:hypothetical protein
VNPSSAVVTSVVIITATTIVRRQRQGTLTGHFLETIVFGFMLLVALLLLAVLMPTVAEVLAYTGLIGAFVINGPEIFKLMGAWV